MYTTSIFILLCKKVFKKQAYFSKLQNKLFFIWQFIDYFWFFVVFVFLVIKKLVFIAEGKKTRHFFY